MLARFEKFVELQRKLTLLNDSNYDDVLDYVLKSDYVRSVSKIALLVQEIYSAYSTRPKNIEIYIRIIKDLLHSEISQEIKSPFKTIFIEESLSGFDDYNKPGICVGYHFLYRLYEENAVTLDDLKPTFDLILQQAEEKPNTVAVLYVFFANILQHGSDFLLYNRLTTQYEIYGKSSNFKQIAALPPKVIDECIHYGHPLDSIEHILDSDNVDKLVQYSLRTDFDINMKFPKLLMEPYSTLQGNPTLICYASFKNSINCFKWLLMNGADINIKDKWGQSIIDFAIAGGSLEIVHIAQSEGLNPFNVEPAIENRQYHIFDWIFDNMELTQNVINESFIYSARYNNAYSLCESIKAGADPNSTTQLWGAIHNAILYSNVEMAMLLSDCEEIDINFKDANGYAPILFATTNKCYKVVQYLALNPRVDINTTDDNGWSCLHRVVADNNYQMVKFFVSIDAFNINLVDKSGKTAYDIAAVFKYTDIMNLLARCKNFENHKH